MFLIITGNGKGKTTSAIGQAIRVLGQGGKVFFAEFIKSDNFPAGEDKILSNFGENFHFEKGGLGFVGILGDKLPIEEHKKKAEETFQKASMAATSGAYNLVVFDEINNALSLNLLSESSVLDFVKKVPKETDIMFTGRNAPVSFLQIADLATDCAEIKHPFQEGVSGEKGREF
ncbi:MAG: cob(I)yrinic acid a,c-diamide adenosyltransferase [Candidatus Paceibacterota bacterium]